MAWTIFTAESTPDVTLHSHNELFHSKEQLQPIEDFYAPEEASECSSSDTPPPLPPPARPLLRFTANHTPKDVAAGFVFGTDPELCDIVIPQGPRASISARQFAVTFRTDTGSVILKNLSRRGTRIKIINREAIRLQSQRAFDDARIRVHLGQTKILLTKPWDSDDIGVEYQAFLAKLALVAPALGRMGPIVKPGRGAALLPASQYTMDRKLGHGGFGTVHRAIHKFTGGFVAIKGFNQSSDASWKEANILCSLRHENIVTFYEFNLRAQDGPQLVMEYTPLGSMLDQSRERNYNDIEGRAIIRQTLQALTYLHARRITHRDIKPANILVFTRDPEMHVKVADFGISKEADEFSTRCGTQRYVAPEVYNPPYTSKADLWSLGVVVLELWVSLPAGPEERETEEQWARKILEQKGKATGTVKAFLENLLEMNPEKRMSAAECLELPFLRQSDGKAHGSIGTAELSMREATDADIREMQSNNDSREHQEGQVNAVAELNDEPPGANDGPKLQPAIVQGNRPDTEYQLGSKLPGTKEAVAIVPRGSPMDIDKSLSVPIPTMPMADYRTVSTQLLRPRPKGQSTSPHDIQMASPPMPLPDTMPVSSKRYIRFFSWRGKYIAYNPSRTTVNITQILRVAGFQRGVFQRRAIQGMVGDVVQEEYGVHDEGTYIVYGEAMQICRHLNIHVKVMPVFLKGCLLEVNPKKSKGR